jgi:hypothetical protein
MHSDFYTTKEKIDDLTEEYSLSNLEEAEKYFKKEGIFDYFIKRISKNLNSEWLIPLKDKGYFEPSKNPPPQEVPEKPGYFLIPYWNVLRYLETVSQENSKHLDKDITNALVQVVNRIINYRDKDGHRIENYRTDWIMLIVLSNLPTDLFEKNHINFIRDSLNSKWGSTLVASDLGKLLIPKLINDKAVDLLIRLIDVMLDYKKQEHKLGGEYVSIMDQYWLAEALKKYKQDIAQLCGIEAASIAIDKMKRILCEDISHFDNIWMPTIEDHPQITSPERYECQIVQFVRDMYVYYPNPEVLRDYIKSLLTEEHPIFRRLAFYTINKHFDRLKELFFGSESNPLETLVTHEIYELLKDHCKDFSEDEIGKILVWIESESLPAEIIKDDNHVAKIKKEWLHALLCSDNGKVIEKYNYYSAIFPGEFDHPGHHYWSESGFVRDESPISAEELSKKSNREIAIILKEFKDEGKFVWGKLSEISLTNTLKQTIVTDPKKFSTDLDHFLSVQPLYIVRILWGLTEAWRNKQDFEWDELLGFMWQLIEPDAFWEEKYEKGKENYRNSIIRAITDLIKEGTRSDEHAFNPDLLPHAKSILLRLLDKVESDLGDVIDIVTSVLNSTKGSIYEALINYSLRYARLYKKKDEIRWEDEVKTEFTKRLDRQIEGTPEFSVILGQYLPNLFYLDNQWVTDHIDKIFLQDDSIHWQATMSGYLYYANKVYEVIYNLLKQTGNFERAIYTEFKVKFATERIVQHISISFLESKESLDDPSSLVTKLLEHADSEQLQKMTEFLWTFRGKLKPTQIAKVKQLWGKIMDIIAENLETPNYHPIVSNLSRWISLIDEIDEDILKWMKQVVKYLDKDHFNTFIIEYLLLHADKTPERVGDIYIEMLTNGIYPLYKEENIKALVRKLYRTHSDLADKICNMYGEKGYVEILEDVYREHH